MGVRLGLRDPVLRCGLDLLPIDRLRSVDEVLLRDGLRSSTGGVLITLAQWVYIAQEVLGLTDVQALALAWVCKSLLPPHSEFLSSSSSSSLSPSLDARLMALLLLFHLPASRSDTKSSWFLDRLPDALRLLVGRPVDERSELTREEVAPLDLFVEGWDDRGKVVPMSGLAPFVGGVTVRSMEEWLRAGLRRGDASQREAAHSTRKLTGMVDRVYVSIEASPRDTGCADVRHCQRALLYVLEPLSFASVYGCTNSIVMVGAVGGIALIEKCCQCTVIVAARGIQIRACENVTLFVWCNTPPIVCGKSRGIVFAPHNAHYDLLNTHLNVTQVSRDTNMWDRSILVDQECQSTLLPPEQFYARSIPFRDACGGAGTPIPSFPSLAALPPPPIYASALRAQREAANELKAFVRRAHLDADTEARVRQAIMKHYHSWLVETGALHEVELIMKGLDAPLQK